jgi:hypothetical protein
MVVFAAHPSVPEGANCPSESFDAVCCQRRLQVHPFGDKLLEDGKVWTLGGALRSPGWEPS